jgi:hypothetical protein
MVGCSGQLVTKGAWSFLGRGTSIEAVKASILRGCAFSFFTCQFSGLGLAFKLEGGGLDERLLKRAKQSVLIGRQAACVRVK